MRWTQYASRSRRGVRHVAPALLLPHHTALQRPHRREATGRLRKMTFSSCSDSACPAGPKRRAPYSNSPSVMLEVNCSSFGIAANLAISIVEGARFASWLRTSVSRRYIIYRTLRGGRCLSLARHIFARRWHLFARPRLPARCPAATALLRADQM